MKICIVGGGSTYTPELMDGLIRNAAAFELEEVVLADTDPHRLKTVGGFCERMRDHRGGRFRLRLALSADMGVAGCDIVVFQIRVGGNRGRHKDETLGLRHNLIGQETTGAGGFAKALRTIPVIRGIVQQIADMAPEAAIVNFTNPSGIITQAIHAMGWSRCIGLCNIPIGMVMDMAAALSVDPAAIELDYVGLNHLSWVRRVRLSGTDITGSVIEALASGGGPANVPEMAYPPDFIRALGMIPSPYLRYFYATSAMLEELRRRPKSRAEEVMELEERLMAIYADPAEREKPELLSQRGGAHYSTIAVELIRAIQADSGAVHIVNVPVGTTFPGLRPTDVAEIAARVYRDRVDPLPVAPAGPEILGLIQQVKAYETLTVDAGLSGSRAKAVMALAANPLVGPEKAVAVLDDIIATHGIELR